MDYDDPDAAAAVAERMRAFVDDVVLPVERTFLTEGIAIVQGTAI